MRQFSKGNSIAEYALPLGFLVVTGAIVGAIALKDAFPTFVTTSVNGAGANGGTIMVQSFGSVAVPRNASQLPPLSNTDMEQLCFTGSGVCMSIPVISETAPDTSGSLGGDLVTKMAYTLLQLPQALKDKGATKELIDMVTKLALEGHGLGEDLKAIESVCRKGATCSGTQEKEAVSKLDALKARLDIFKQHWDELQALLQANPDMLKDFPEAKQIIESKVAEIAGLISQINAKPVYNTSSSTSWESAGTGINISRWGGSGNNGGETLKQNPDGTWSNNNGGETLKQNPDGTWSKKKTKKTKKKVGISFGNGSYPIDTVHQDSNSICQNGGTAQCIWRKKDEYWKPVRENNPVEQTASTPAHP
jgi:hypothetical protein